MGSRRETRMHPQHRYRCLRAQEARVEGLQGFDGYRKLATSAEIIARNFFKDYGEKLQKEGNYFQFNATHGLQGIGLEEWRMFDAMDAATMAYLEDVKEAIQACCDRLKDPSETSRSPASPVASLLEQMASAISTNPGIFDVPHNSSPYFTGCSDLLLAIEKHSSTDIHIAPKGGS